MLPAPPKPRASQPVDTPLTCAHTGCRATLACAQSISFSRASFTHDSPLHTTQAPRSEEVCALSSLRLPSPAPYALSHPRSHVHIPAAAQRCRSQTTSIPRGVCTPVSSLHISPAPASEEGCAHSNLSLQRPSPDPFFSHPCDRIPCFFSRKFVRATHSLHSGLRPEVQGRWK
jgi:hypothetical protein